MSINDGRYIVFGFYNNYRLHVPHLTLFSNYVKKRIILRLFSFEDLTMEFIDKSFVTILVRKIPSLYIWN